MARTVICIASGPSLTKEDCCSAVNSGLTTIAVNNSWQIMPATDIIFSCDYLWWKANKNLVPKASRLVTTCRFSAQTFGIELFHSDLGNGGFSSGQKAIEFSVFILKAQKVILIGYDYSLHNGTHWHGPHEALANPTEQHIEKWIEYMNKLELPADVEVLNCSRFTSLRRFKTYALDTALDESGL